MTYQVDENTPWIDEVSGGTKYRFYILCPYDRFEIVNRLRETKRQRLIANLDAGEIKGEQRTTELEAFEDRWDDEEAYIKFVNSAAADIEISERALPHEHKAQAKQIVSGLRLPQSKMIEFKVTLAGLQLRSRANAPQPEGQPDPNPVAGAVYGQQPTGSPSDA